MVSGASILLSCRQGAVPCQGLHTAASSTLGAAEHQTRPRRHPSCPPGPAWLLGKREANSCTASECECALQGACRAAHWHRKASQQRRARGASIREQQQQRSLQCRPNDTTACVLRAAPPACRPSQVLPSSAADSLGLANVPHKSITDVSIIFFGTSGEQQHQPLLPRQQRRPSSSMGVRAWGRVWAAVARGASSSSVASP